MSHLRMPVELGRMLVSYYDARQVQQTVAHHSSSSQNVTVGAQALQSIKQEMVL